MSRTDDVSCRQESEVGTSSLASLSGWGVYMYLPYH